MMEDNIFIYGFDPGSNTMGMAKLCISLPTLEITAITTELVNVSHIGGVPGIYDNLQNRLYKAKNIMEEMMTDIPFAVSIESAFINPGRPNAAIPLAKSQLAIEWAVRDRYPCVPIVFYPPSVIKNSVGVGGGKGKEPMEEKVLNHKEIKKCLLNKSITEHEIDAIAIAYTELKRLRENKYLLTR